MIDASELHTNPVTKPPPVEITSTKSLWNVFGSDVGDFDKV
ncbi:hypothetical protein [Photorhabdus viridis]